MDIRCPEAFLAVAANLSFTRTAREQPMSVSAVSRSVQRLEDELGAQFFDRDRRGMQVTPAALQLQGVAERIIAAWRGLQQAFCGGITVAGDLRVFCSVTATHRLLSPLLAAYRENCPQVAVSPRICARPLR